MIDPMELFGRGINMENWTAFYYGMAIIGVISLFALMITNPIEREMERVEELATGKITDHHRYIPYD